MVIFRVQYPRAGSHPLDLTGVYHALVPLVVPVFELAVDDIGHYLHIAVWVEAKASARLYYVVVEDAQRPKVHLFRILVVCKRKMPVRREPVLFVVVMLV